MYSITLSITFVLLPPLYVLQFSRYNYNYLRDWTVERECPQLRLGLSMKCHFCDTKLQFPRSVLGRLRLHHGFRFTFEFYHICFPVFRKSNPSECSSFAIAIGSLRDLILRISFIMLLTTLVQF